LPAWDDHKWVRPEPGSVWTILPSGAAVFDISDRPARQLGLVAPAYGAVFVPETPDILTELRQIRIALAFLVQEFGGTLTELVESDGEALEIAS
jgi:hypothetical protein